MIAQDSRQSWKNLKDGEEPESILLALLWSPVSTLIDRKKALLATGTHDGKPATIIVLFDVVPTDKGLSLVGSANKEESANK